MGRQQPSHHPDQRLCGTANLICFSLFYRLTYVTIFLLVFDSVKKKLPVLVHTGSTSTDSAVYSTYTVQQCKGAADMLTSRQHDPFADIVTWIS